MKKVHWMVRSVQMVAALFVLIGCLVLFVYSPFYSKTVIYILNTFVPVEVNEVAAKSQKLGGLNDNGDMLEPGSNLWIARQAYLKLLEEDIQKHNSQHITVLQQRYKVLVNLINQEQAQEKQQSDVAVQVPLSSAQASSEAEPDRSLAVRELLELNRSENKELIEKYKLFLLTHEIEPDDLTVENAASENLLDDVDLLADQNDAHKSIQRSQPYAIVVLGGGLALDKHDGKIVVNNYTRLRLEKTLEIEKKYHLPIVLSGVEAPYMQAWLQQRGVHAKLLENRSMNTCENTRFSSLLLQKKGGAPTVILITDQYHMPRTRRLFALNGIETIPVEAPMPTQLTTWRPSQKNYDHSRRANYELLATVRDVFFGLSDCREIP